MTRVAYWWKKLWAVPQRSQDGGAGFVKTNYRIGA